MSELNIYQRLSKITEELGYVAKNLSVGNQYKAVGEGDVLAAVKPLEIKYGVYSYPLNREIVFQDVLEEEKEYNGKTTIKTSFFMRVQTTYRFVNTDLPSEFVDQVSYGDGTDSLDKSCGKAMTYSDKYSLLKAYKIQTGDDPDQTHSDSVKVRKQSYTPKPTYNEPQPRYNDEKTAVDDSTRIGLEKILASLDKPENATYKRTVLSTICKEQGVDGFMDIKFLNGFTYVKLINRVKELIDELKKIEKVGI